MCSLRLVQLPMVLAILAVGIPAANTAPPEPATATAIAKESKPADKPRVVLGRVEWVVLQDIHVKIKARIDTGAGISSVHAKILEIKQTDAGERVHFQIDDSQGNQKKLWRDIVGWANIKVMGTDQKNRRPVVRLDVCIGGKRLEGRVNLTDRGEFLYPMLIGRNLLNTGKFLVDPSQRYLQEPGCE